MRKPELIKNIPVTAIDFGKNDGKFDAIEKYFFETGLTEAVENGSKSIIVGRKGTGKSALAYHLKNRANSTEDSFVSILSFKDVPVALLEQFSDEEHRYSNKFVLLWKYVFLVELTKLLLQDATIDPSRLEPLETFVNINFPVLKRTPREYLKATIEKRFKISLKVIEAEQASVTEDGVVRVLDFINDLQERLRELMPRGHRFTVIIDELDDTYDNSPEYYNILVAMFKAGMDINGWFSQDYKSARITMMLRSDIYDSIQYADKNKWSDMTHEINWVPDPDQTAFESDLFGLINRRIGVALADEAQDDCNYWNEVFEPGTVISDLRPFQFMLSRSYYRPRDIIQFCKEVQLLSRKRKETKQFSRRSIKDAEYSYSQWFKKEIEDELRVKIPFIQDVFEALSRHGQPTFRASDINQQFQRFRIQTKLPINSVLQILFDFSVVGMFLDDGGHVPVFRFRDPYIDFREGKTYSVHYGLRPALRMGGRFNGGSRGRK